MIDSDRIEKDLRSGARPASPIGPGVAEPQRQRGHAEHHERERGEKR